MLGQGCEAADPRPSRQATCSRQEQGQQADREALGGGPSANRQRDVHGGAVQDAQGTSHGGGLAAIVSSLEQNMHGGPGLADALTRFCVRVDVCGCVSAGAFGGRAALTELAYPPIRLSARLDADRSNESTALAEMAQAANAVCQHPH